MEQKKDKLIDLDGYGSGFKITKKLVLCIAAAVAVFAVCTVCGPSIGLESTKAGMALGLIFAAIILWVTNQLEFTLVLLVMIFTGVLLGLMSFSDVQSSMGSSSFLMMLGMFIVAEGANQTNIAKRLAYLALSKLGKRATFMLLAIFGATTLMSAFCSNMATTLVMASICIGIIQELDALTPGNGTKFGKAIMLLISIGAALGGTALISGSPGMNAFALMLFENTTGMTISYAQWAVLGGLGALLLIIPTWFIYTRYFKVQNDNTIRTEIFEQKLRDLGSMGGTEIRWILTVLGMVITMMLGVNTGLAAMIFAIIALCPIVGCMDPKKVFQSLPLSMFIMIALSTAMSLLFTNYNIHIWLAGFFEPLMSGLPPFLFMLMCTLTMALLNNLFANAAVPMYTICITVFGPLSIALGYNPCLMLLPCIFLGPATIVLGSQFTMYLTYNYGYWDMKDPIVPGIVTVLLWAVVFTVVAYFVGPIAGMSLYL